MDPDAATSRAYYAAFYGVSALFVSEGREFRKHTALEAAVHRDLVKSGRWATETGAAFSWLATMRMTGDYGGKVHVSRAEAEEAVHRARHVLAAVRDCGPEQFPLPPEPADERGT